MIKKVVTPRHKLKSKDMGKNQNCLDSEILLYTLFKFFFSFSRVIWAGTTAVVAIRANKRKLRFVLVYSLDHSSSLVIVSAARLQPRFSWCLYFFSLPICCGWIAGKKKKLAILIKRVNVLLSRWKYCGKFTAGRQGLVKKEKRFRDRWVRSQIFDIQILQHSFITRLAQLSVDL